MQTGLKAKLYNSVDYAEQMIGLRQGRYAEMRGRRPGVLVGELGSPLFLWTISELRWLKPTTKKRRLSLTQHYLQAMWALMSLATCARARFLWALWTTALNILPRM